MCLIIEALSAVARPLGDTDSRSSPIVRDVTADVTCSYVACAVIIITLFCNLVTDLYLSMTLESFWTLSAFSVS
jgi:hypothetical protein